MMGMAQAFDIQNVNSICPVFKCKAEHNGINMTDQVFCFKADVDNPFNINLKTCPEGSMCHKDLNRCMMDPYQQVTNRENGSLCS